jgi:hypothetical protein
MTSLLIVDILSMLAINTDKVCLGDDCLGLSPCSSFELLSSDVGKPYRKSI